MLPCSEMMNRFFFMGSSSSPSEPAARRPLWPRLVQGMTVLHAAAHEIGPVGDRGDRVGLVGQQAPERRMVPAEVLTRAVAVAPDPVAEFPDLGGQLVPGHRIEVVIHLSTIADFREGSAGDSGSAGYFGGGENDAAKPPLTPRRRTSKVV